MKKCQNGHFYSDELNSCPYCPAAEVTNENSDKTVISGSEQKSSNDHLKTKIFGSGNSPSPTPSSIGSRKRDLNKTFIDLGDDLGEGGTTIPAMRASRKLVGWLVSYTIDSMGRDFRLFEGKNKIGVDSGCEITIPNDPSVSSVNSTILFRHGHFKLKDEFSTNGTFLNDADIDDNTPDLNDGDIIKVGKTIFKFKCAL